VIDRDLKINRLGLIIYCFSIFLSLGLFDGFFWIFRWLINLLDGKFITFVTIVGVLNNSVNVLDHLIENHINGIRYLEISIIVEFG